MKRAVYVMTVHGNFAVKGSWQLPKTAIYSRNDIEGIRSGDKMRNLDRMRVLDKSSPYERYIKNDNICEGYLESTDTNIVNIGTIIYFRVNNLFIDLFLYKKRKCCINLQITFLRICLLYSQYSVVYFKV